MQLRTKGFSLVELSIVLVVIGLLIGGVLAGQAVIRAAQLRAVGNDLNSYVVSAYQFRDKYSAFPGDVVNATLYWGADDGGDGIGTDCRDDTDDGLETCNGNGDGVFNSWGAYSYEQSRFWQHLSNEGLIEGRYNGRHYGHAVIGQNAPRSRLQNVTARLGSGPTDIDADGGPGLNNSINYYDYFNYGNFVFYGRKPQSTWNPHAPFATATEAWNIDTKFDDGKPGTGNWLSYKAGGTASWLAGSGNCANSSNYQTAEYNLTYSPNGCAFIVLIR